jgi:putative procalin
MSGNISNDINEGISYVLEKLGETVETMTLTTFYEDYEKYPTFLLKISII